MPAFGFQREKIPSARHKSRYAQPCSGADQADCLVLAWYIATALYQRLWRQIRNGHGKRREVVEKTQYRETESLSDSFDRESPV